MINQTHTRQNPSNQLLATLEDPLWLKLQAIHKNQISSKRHYQQQALFFFQTIKSSYFLFLSSYQQRSTHLQRPPSLLSLYYIRQSMGQDSPKQQIKAKYIESKEPSAVSSARRVLPTNIQPNSRVQCEGLLTLRSTPFKNCMEIYSEQGILFLQNVETTLKMLLESRLHTNKLFMAEDIEKLIQAVTFTLAYLQQKGVIYKDIHCENIYYDKGDFKLLPNELIETNTYQKLKASEEVHPSPELIIAIRCGEDDVIDEDILQKSNVFTLGMTLLEVCTLLPSSECYDPQNYDILDAIINERITLIEEYYGQKTARIIANMLDYDYTERMNFKEMSIWINRQLRTQKSTEKEPQEANSMATSQIEHPQPKALLPQTQSNVSLIGDKPKSKLTKNNSVYMGFPRQNQNQREERNKIYVNDNPRVEMPFNKGYNFEDLRNYRRNQQPYEKTVKANKNIEKKQFYNPVFNESDSFKFVEPPKQELRHPNPYCEDFKLNKKEDSFERNFEKDVTKRIAKQPPKAYRNYLAENLQENERDQPPQLPKKDKRPLKEIGNQFYPSIDQILKPRAPLPPLQVKGPLGQNGALSRIKQQILKSRKLIEQFKRSEGLKL